MKKIIILLSLLLLSISFVLDASAKRFGGGRSFGAARPASAFSRQFSSQTAQRITNPVSSVKSTASKWLAPLAGLALGAGLGSLLGSMLMGHGLGGGLMTGLLLLGVVYFLWQAIRRKVQSMMAPAMGSTSPNTQRHSFLSGMQPTDHAPYSNVIRPEAFGSAPAAMTESESNPREVEDLLDQAKLLFTRMQSAYDNKNLQEIKEYTSPNVLSEIESQIQARGQEENCTHILSLNAEWLGSDTLFQETLHSIRFSGIIKEDAQQAAQPFVEIWHLKRNPATNALLIAGIQQETASAH